MFLFYIFYFPLDLDYFPSISLLFSRPYDHLASRSPLILPTQPLPPLHYAAKHSNAECAKLLIAAGAPVDEFCDITKSTPLTEAARSGNAEVLAVLLAAGAVPTRRDATGRVPITHALCWSRENTTVALASLEDAEAAAKSIENKADNDLFTSLHNGIMFNSTCIAAFLKAAKATFQRTETA